MSPKSISNKLLRYVIVGRSITLICMRLFIGIPLASIVIDELTKLTASLRAKDGHLRWSPPETWHVTLQFLGSTDQQQYNCLIPRLREIYLPRIPIRLESTGIFDRAEIFYVDVKPAPALLVLQQAVIDATTPCGFAPESRPYHPHITLARAKDKEATSALDRLKSRSDRDPKFTLFMADEFVLYESFTLPTGSRYEIRERFPLGHSNG
jgi:2'-5' RNA ligase